MDKTGIGALPVRGLVDMVRQLTAGVVRPSDEQDGERSSASQRAGGHGQTTDRM